MAQFTIPASGSLGEFGLSEAHFEKRKKKREDEEPESDEDLPDRDMMADEDEASEEEPGESEDESAEAPDEDEEPDEAEDEDEEDTPKKRKRVMKRMSQMMAMMAEGQGPEIHSAKAHRCVDKVQAKGHSESSAWAICTTSIGKEGVYAQGHGGSARAKRKVHEAELDAVVEELVEGCKNKKKRAMYESNDCHTPAGSPQGGQFCSKGEDTYAHGGEEPPMTAEEEKRLGPYLRKHGISRGPTLRDTPTTATSLAQSKGTPLPPAPDAYRSHSLSALAGIIRKDWSKQGKGVNYAAKPYLSAMADLENITDNYGADSGEMIVAYFLGNARSWKGPVAKVVKAELQRRLKRR